MDFTCLYIRLLIVLLLILMLQSNSCVFAQRDDEDFPHVTPDKLQFFRYEAVDISCEHLSGLTDWRVMQKLIKANGNIFSICSSSEPTCTISPTFEWHSGEYWCENTEGSRSGKINISVSAGSVILEVSPRPVLEGNEATLRCKNKDSMSKHIVNFYKDGVHLKATYESKHTIQNVSKSDEGLYKCKIFGAGESPESRIAVSKMVHDSSMFHPSLTNTSELPLLLMVVGISVMILLLVLIGLFLSRKKKVLCFFSGIQTAASQPDYENVSIAGPHMSDYANVQRQKNKKVYENATTVDPNMSTYANVPTYNNKKGRQGNQRKTKSAAVTTMKKDRGTGSRNAEGETSF